MTSTNVAHHQDKNCFILSADSLADGELVEAKLEYKLLGNNGIDFTHTYVPPEFRGKGFAEQLVKTGLTWAEEQGFSIEASCSYVSKMLARRKS